jgi:hypothetical protein
MAAGQEEKFQREVSLRRVFDLGFATIAAQPFTTLGLAFVAGALPSRFFEIVQDVPLRQLLAGASRAGAVGLSLASIAVSVTLAAVGEGALAVPVWCQAAKRTAGFGESLGAVLSVLAWVLATGAMTGIAEMAGLILLVVPGLVLTCIWAVSVPIVVAEQRGPFAALRRSAYLTKNARWKVFALLMVNLGVSLAMWFLLPRLMLVLPHTPAGIEPRVLGFELPLLPNLVVLTVQTVTGCVFGCLWSALYIELRDWKEGPPAHTLAEVFR